MDLKVLIAAPLAAVMFVASAQDLTLPKNWSTGSTGRSAKSYAVGLDPQATFQGMRSISVQSREDVSPIDHGAAIQYAYGYQGKRVRFSGWLRTAGVKTWAGMFMNAKQDSPENFFGSKRQGLTEADLPFGAGGKTDINGWTPVSIVADVPNQPGALVSVGVVVMGQGQAWLTDLRFEEVDQTVPTTATRVGLDLAAYEQSFVERHKRAQEVAARAPRPPQNLSLE